MNEQHLNLVLMRHAKSAYPAGVADHDRPLAPRGTREAGLAGDWLRANLGTVDAVLCSSAVRARRTLACTGIEAPVRYAERLYEAAPGTEMRKAIVRASAQEMQKQFLLSDRETEVLTLYAMGLTQAKIAEELCIAPGTAHTHVKRIYSKTDLHSRQALLDYIEQYTN